MTDPHPSRVYLNNRAGGILDATATRLTTPVFGCVHHVVSADLDRDGDTDLVLAMGGNCGPQQDNLVLLNDGRGHLAVTPLVGMRGWTAVVAVGDLDGDALPDLFFGNLSGPSELWLNQGSGSFSNASARVPGGTTTTLSATIVDLDRDGLNDIVAGVAFAGGGALGLDTYRNLGQASFIVDRGLIHQAGSPLPNFVQAADMDRDGDGAPVRRHARDLHAGDLDPHSQQPLAPQPPGLLPGLRPRPAEPTRLPPHQLDGRPHPMARATVTGPRTARRTCAAGTPG